MDAKRSFSLPSLVALLAGNAFILVIALTVPGLWVQIVATAAITLGLWAALRAMNSRSIDEAAAPAVQAAEEPAQVEAPPRAAPPAQPSDAAAVQMLSILQREGRLVDFLQEDITAYDDAQVGAAVRTVHEGCRRALAEHVTLEPVMERPEGETVTVEPGFDAHAVRLTGHVAGDPPFTGTLQHRGWRVASLELPELMQTQNRVVAAAEVEVS